MMYFSLKDAILEFLMDLSLTYAQLNIHKELFSNHLDKGDLTSSTFFLSHSSGMFNNL